MNTPDPVRRVRELFAAFEPTWCLCGGWAVDAWIGRQTRAHRDLDVAVFQEAQGALFQHLDGWRLIGHETPDAEHQDPWDGRSFEVGAHIHASANDGFELDVQIEERSGDGWLLTREPRIQVPIARFAERPAWDLPTVAPEIILFYKAIGSKPRDPSERPRPRDEEDLGLLLPHLLDEQRRWLRDAVSRVEPGHPWLSSIG
jgi:Aminoglycoside-2''-adenylyltransferase